MYQKTIRALSIVCAVFLLTTINQVIFADNEISNDEYELSLETRVAELTAQIDSILSRENDYPQDIVALLKYFRTMLIELSSEHKGMVELPRNRTYIENHLLSSNQHLKMFKDNLVQITSIDLSDSLSEEQQQQSNTIKHIFTSALRLSIDTYENAIKYLEELLKSVDSAGEEIETSNDATTKNMAPLVSDKNTDDRVIYMTHELSFIKEKVDNYIGRNQAQNSLKDLYEDVRLAANALSTSPAPLFDNDALEDFRAHTKKEITATIDLLKQLKGELRETFKNDGDQYLEISVELTEQYIEYKQIFLHRIEATIKKLKSTRTEEPIHTEL